MKLPNFFVLGSYGRNSGKTLFIEHLIDSFLLPLTALKVTVIRGGKCPRGGIGCGVCTSLKGNFLITEETNRKGDKDTCRLLAHGAKRVFWLRVRAGFLKEGMEELLKYLEPATPVICESNSIMELVDPALYFLLRAKGNDEAKISALRHEKRANLIINTEPEDSHFDFKRLNFSHGRWLMD